MTPRGLASQTRILAGFRIDIEVGNPARPREQRRFDVAAISSRLRDGP